MKRVLLKLSGEALAGEKHTGFDEATVTEVAKQVKVLVEEGVEVGVVIGGGNFWRGRSSETIAVSYTHLDVYKRQGSGRRRIFKRSTGGSR